MRWIIGMDEVGRGPLAGPVCVGAILVDEDAPRVQGVRDSKKMTPKAREDVARLLRESPHVRLTVATRPAEDIDRLGMSRVLQECFLEAATALLAAQDKVAEVRVDGNPFPLDLPVPVRFIVKGDDSDYAIGAASIIAKVCRDFLMNMAAKEHPGYGWERNSGYGTAEHTDAIQKLGLTPLHRRTFCRRVAPQESPLFDDPVIFELFGDSAS